MEELQTNSDDLVVDPDDKMREFIFQIYVNDTAETSNIVALETLLTSVSPVIIQEAFITIITRMWLPNLSEIDLFLRHGAVVDNDFPLWLMSPDVLRRLLREPSLDHTKMDNAIIMTIRHGDIRNLRILIDEFHISLPNYKLISDALEILRTRRGTTAYDQIEAFIRERAALEALEP